MKRIVAIVGMCGAGKSVVCDYLESIGYKKVYFGGVTMKKLREENLEITPDNEKMMREKLRKKLGMGAYAITLLPEIEKLSESNNVVLDGLYSWEELKILKDKFPEMITLAVVVDKSIRYERVGKRIVRPLNEEEVVKRDISEIENIAKAGPIAYADYYILNNSSIEDITLRIDEILKR